MGRNVLVQLDTDEYMRAVEQLMFSAIRRLFIRRGDKIPTILEVKAKLVEGFELANIKVIVMG